MFLVFGSNHLAVRLSKWCANRHRCVLVGLASTLPVEEPLEGCEIIALPSPLKLDSIPLIGHIPTAILYLDNNALKDENPLEEIKIKWPDTPILTTIPLEGDGIDLVSIDDISFAAMQDRIRSWERRTSASVVKAYLKAIPKGSKVAIFCHDNPDPDALASGLAMLKLVEKIGLEGSILHGGLIEHQQNRAMVQLLEIPTRRLILDWEVADIIADSQVVITVDFHKPGANNILPVDCIPNIVIDHHTVEDSVAADIVLVRSEFSSTSSLITSLLMSLNHQIDIKTATALAFGAEGVGLCRTEHMFLGDRLPLIQKFLNADNGSAENVLEELEETQRSDFVELFKVAGSLPVTVRLLDAPFHEFMDVSHPDSEHNPMLGTRGVRLALLRHELYRMQARSITKAVSELVEEGGEPSVSIMIPLVVDRKELGIIRSWVEEEITETAKTYNLKNLPQIGTMIETPRAALSAAEIAKEADFFSFGTNDLTQMVFGFSRDDIEKEVMDKYLELGVLSHNPFKVLDEAAVAPLIAAATRAARISQPGIEVGVCGEHGGDPVSIALLVKAGVDYVSCSPFRIPVARLATAQALIAQDKN